MSQIHGLSNKVLEMIIEDACYPQVRYKNDYRRKDITFWCKGRTAIEWIKLKKKVLTIPDVKMILRIKLNKL